MDRLLAQDAILKTGYQHSNAIDDLDREGLLSVFIPDKAVTLDMTRIFPDTSIAEITPEEWWQRVCTSLGGFSGTHHQIGNSIVTFDENGPSKAYLKQKIIAHHAIETDGRVETVTGWGIQEFDMELWNGEWKIRSLNMYPTCPLDRPDLYERAKERAGKGIGRVAKAISG